MPRRSKKKQKDNTLPILLMIIGGLLLIAVVVLLIQPGPAAQPTTGLGNQNIPFPEIERVSLEDAFRAYENNEAVFLDVRSQDAFAAGHIPGSLNIPLGELESRLAELDPNQWIITYCT